MSITSTIRIAVSVSQGWDNYHVLNSTLDTLLSGDRRGSIELVDVMSNGNLLLSMYAKENQIPFLQLPNEASPHWVLSISRLIVFWDSVDPVLKHMVDLARTRRLPVQVILVETS